MPRFWVGAALVCFILILQGLNMLSDRPRDTLVETVGHVLQPKQLAPIEADMTKFSLPEGFRIEKFAEGLINPRVIAVADDGTTYTTRRSVGDVVMLKDTDGDGKADVIETVANRPDMHGIAIDGNKAYLVTIKDIYVADIESDGRLGPLKRIVDDLPDAGQHANRTIAVGPDGMLYVSIGSTCNDCIEGNEDNATIMRIAPDGSDRRIYASGLRNTVGFGFEPSSGEIYGFDNGIDWLGDDGNPEELNLIKDGHKYGWPYVYGNDETNIKLDPPGIVTSSDWAKVSDEPVLTYTAHSAPMGLAFYTGNEFPEDYRGDAFVAMHGSWNRDPPSGYEVVRVDFVDGKPKSVKPFLSGFLVQTGEEEYGYLGRPFGIAVTKDGSLLVGDDANGTIYRVVYDSPGPAVAAKDQGPSTRIHAIANMAPAPKDDSPSELAATALGAPATLTVSSPALSAGRLDIRNSAYGENISPPLAWTKGPEGTKSYAVIVEDPDAGLSKPVTHWLLFNVPPDVHELREGLPDAPALEIPKDAMQGVNSHGTTGYFGPRPRDGGEHHYHFQVFALDTKLDLEPGATRGEVIKAMRGHVLAQGSLVATFQKPSS